MAYQIIIINSNNDRNTNMEVGGGAILRGCKRYSYFCLLGSCKGKESCEEARKLGSFHRAPVTLLMGNEASCSPCHSPGLGGAPGGCDHKGSARAAWAELCRGEGGSESDALSFIFHAFQTLCSLGV